ncbi:MAG: hypothetical protein ACRDDZ_12290 [Marinifilaceae bacterium]
MVTHQGKRVINYELVILGLIVVLSGMIMQLGYHIGNPGVVVRETKTILGLFYSNWQLMHKVAISFFFALCTYHIWSHRNWYVAIISKRLYRRNIQLVLFSVIFIFSVVTGFLPWIIDGHDGVRITLIEIHDKISVVLIVFMVLHVGKRIKRLR